MLLSRPVPEEVWLEIMSHLADDRETLRAAIDAECDASFAATRIYWANLTSEKGLLDELEEQPDDQRQFYANMIRKVTIDFKLPFSEHEGRGLDFPLVRDLTISHDSVPFGQRPRTYAKIKRFVNPLLRNLDVGCEYQTDLHTEPITDNFLPRLSASIGLDSLKICARVKNGTPQELVLVLNSCQQLRTLHLAKHTEPLIDQKTLEAMANHPSLKDLLIERRLNGSITSSIAPVSQPFRNVTALEITTDTAATRLFVSRLQRLKRLSLTATGLSSIFASLRGLNNLRHLFIKFLCYSLTEGDLTHLGSLKKLETIEFTDTDDVGDLLEATSISPALLAAVLGSLPDLQSFTLHAINNLGDPFLIALGRACRKLDELTLTGQFTLQNLENESAVLFPCLTLLQLGSLTPSTPISPWGGFRRYWTDIRAQDIIRHAPNLLYFDGGAEGSNEYGDMVEEAWKILKRDGHMYIGG
jgi:hypothetical protein